MENREEYNVKTVYRPMNSIGHIFSLHCINKSASFVFTIVFLDKWMSFQLLNRQTKDINCSGLYIIFKDFCNAIHNFLDIHFGKDHCANDKIKIELCRLKIFNPEEITCRPPSYDSKIV